MGNNKQSSHKGNPLSRLYDCYFVSRRTKRQNDNSISLEQPSELREVESFTRYGITDDMMIRRGERCNAKLEGSSHGVAGIPR